MTPRTEGGTPAYCALCQRPGHYITADHRRPVHVCAECVDCLHDGAKCCGCYDGACCKEAEFAAVDALEPHLPAGQALREAAAWIAEALGYPVQVTMPNDPMPQALWDALVDHIHADESGQWHGNELSREETESWLADEAGRGQ